MADVKQLLREYIQRQEAGGDPDAAPFLERASEGDRAMLETLIDGYWMTRPPKRWDAEAAQGSLAARVASRVAETLATEQEEPAAAWATLRHRAKLSREQVVERLASALGVAGKEQKVHAYYHELENGWLDSERVSPSVFESLSQILGASADWLRGLGGPAPRAASPGISPSSVMARKAKPDPELAEGMASPPAGRPVPAEDEWDEVDELFRGG